MDFRGKRILIFGDSISDGPNTPGGLLAKKLAAGGAAAVKVDAKTGRSAYNFFTTREDWSSLLAADRAWQPDIVIVALGSNDIGIGPKATGPAMQRLKESFPASVQFVAVGPLTYGVQRDDLNRAAQPIVDTMRAVFPTYIDARPLTTPVSGRTSDGVHFTAAGAAPYAQKLYDAISSKVTLSTITQHITSAGATPVLFAGVLVLGVLVLRRFLS